MTTGKRASIRRVYQEMLKNVLSHQTFTPKSRALTSLNQPKSIQVMLKIAPAIILSFVEHFNMERTNISDLKTKFGQKVKIQGWLQTLRDQKRMQFLVLRDPTGAVQIVNEREHDPELAARISALTHRERTDHYRHTGRERDRQAGRAGDATGKPGGG